MTTDKTIPWLKIFAKPTTKEGLWALWLALASFVLNFMWMILPGGAAASFFCGLLGGIFALIAIVRLHERSWLVFLAVLPLIWVLVFLVAEIFIPH